MVFLRELLERIIDPLWGSYCEIFNDDRLLIKPVQSAKKYLPYAKYEPPYDGAKEMLLVDDVDNREFLTGLFKAMYEELPKPKEKRNSECAI